MRDTCAALRFAHDVATRVGEHRRGEDAQLTQVFAERGISFKVAGIWPNAGRDLEGKLRLAAHRPSTERSGMGKQRHSPDNWRAQRPACPLGARWKRV